MKQIATNSLDDTFKEFLDKTETEVALPRGGVRYLRRLTTTTHGEDKAREIFNNTRRRLKRQLEARCDASPWGGY